MEQCGPIEGRVCAIISSARGLLRRDVQHVVERALFAQLENHAESWLHNQSVEINDVFRLQHAHNVEFFAQIADLFLAREFLAGFERDDLDRHDLVLVQSFEYCR